MTMKDIGTISVRPGVQLPIIDCKKWRIVHGNPDCSDSHDLSSCETCEHRVSRDGNLTDPPLFGDSPLPRRAPPPPPATPPESTEAADGKWRGLGDVVASATKAVGISPCGGCRKRQELLNKIVPFSGDAPEK